MTRINLLAVHMAKSQLNTAPVAAVGDNQQAAWLKEMQRAQSEAWFRHPLLIHPEFFGLSHTGIEMQEDEKPEVTNTFRHVSDGGVEQSSPLAHSVFSSVINAFSIDVGDITQEAEGVNKASSENLLQMRHSLALRTGGRAQGDGPRDSLAVFFLRSEAIVSAVGSLYEHTELESLLSQPALSASPVVQPVNAAELVISVLSQPGIDVRQLSNDVEKIVADTIGRSARNEQIPMKDNTPVRVSAHWSGDCVSVWLGVSSSHLQEISTIVRRVKALVAEHGASVQSIVCNGKHWDVTTNTADEEFSLDCAGEDVVAAELNIFEHTGDRHGN